MTENGACPRVLICEDSRTYAAALKRVLEHDRDIEVVAVHATAEKAIAAIPRLRPDLVTMDLELPGMSGIEAVEHIMGTEPVPILVLSSDVGPRSDKGGAALAAGALEAVSNEDLDLRDPAGPGARAFRHRVKILSGARVIRHPRSRLARRAAVARRGQATAAAVGVCASTGGPHALATLVRGLPEDFSLPVLVVQHMSAGFTEGLVRWLAGITKLPVRLAEDGVEATPGVWVAREQAHLVLEPSGRLHLDTRTVNGRHRPSGDVLLASIADSVGKGAVAVVLTGMGRDGAEGLAAVRRAGGLTIAQDEPSCAVYGMPRAAAERGAELRLPPADIGAALSRLRVLEGVT